MNRRLIVLGAGLVAACAAYDGRGLVPGTASRDDVLRVMGEPAMRWPAAGGELLAYPRGPLGLQTFMVRVGADGRLLGIENVLDEAHFARLQNGTTSRDEVLRLLGPPAERTAFASRREDVWTYRFRNVNYRQALFHVTFDAAGIVRGTFQHDEYPNDADRNSL